MREEQTEQNQNTDNVDQSARATEASLWRTLASLGKLAAVLHGALLGAGYMYLAGYLSNLGIEISELELGLPTLLFYGYFFTLSAMVDSGILTVMLIIILSGAFLTPIIFFLLRKANIKTPWATRAYKAYAAVTVLFLALALPAVPNLKGEAAAKSQEVKEMGMLSNFEKIQITNTDKGEILGSQVIADRHYTFLRSGYFIYKISNDTGKIVRSIQFSQAANADSDS